MFTPKEEEFVKENYLTMTNRQMAEKLNRTINEIKYLRQMHEWRSRKKFKQYYRPKDAEPEPYRPAYQFNDVILGQAVRYAVPYYTRENEKIEGKVIAKYENIILCDFSKYKLAFSKNEVICGDVQMI